MARNKINAEMEARKGRRRMQELLALGMRNDDAVCITAVEFCVQEATVYAWRCNEDDAELNEAIKLREAQAQQIWDKLQALAYSSKGSGNRARTRKVAEDKPQERTTRRKREQMSLF